MAGNWLVWAILSAVFAALTAIFTKVGVRSVDSNLAALVHTAVVLVMLLAVSGATGNWLQLSKLPFRVLPWLIASGLTTGASWVCYFRALQLGDASKVVPIDKSSVVLVTLLAFLFLGERPILREWSGILLVVVGVVVLSMKK
jgi:transporter family protein